MSSSPHILGFCGPARAGKTTAACTIVGRFPGWNRLSFADPLRAMLAALGLTPDDMSERKEQPMRMLGGRTPRYALQTLGTEWGRKLMCDDLWLRAAERRAFLLMGEGQSVVFDDVRFDNEAAMIRGYGGHVVRLARPGFSHSAAHASEAGISPSLVDHTIEAEDVAHLTAGIFAFIDRLHHDS